MKSTKNRAISIMICLLMLAQIVPSSWSSVPVFAYSPEPEEMANTKNDIDLPIDPFHVLSYVSAKPATCTDSGNKAYYACSDCGKWFEDSLGTVEITDKSSVVIPASGHTPAEAVRENEVAAICCAAGSYDEVVYCSVCHEEVSREQKRSRLTRTRTIGANGYRPKRLPKRSPAKKPAPARTIRAISKQGEYPYSVIRTT